MAKQTPNIFDYATSELSQDAVLAYIIKWADPAYAATFPKLNKLGKDLLVALLTATGKVQPPAEIKTLCVQTQDKRIDVGVEVNDSVFLIIEDKKNANARWKQIEGYQKAVAEDGFTGQIVSVYLKTGNEAKALHPKDADGRFVRQDLLRVLANNADTDDIIVAQFHAHLQRWEDDTMSYQNTKLSEEWSWEAHQGYFRALEDELDNANWGYSANKGGGELIFGWWDEEGFGCHKMEICTIWESCTIWLQIHHVKGLFIRLGTLYKNGEQVKVPTDLLREWWSRAQTAAESFDSFRIKKPARLSPGKSANFAQFIFDDGEYRATKPDGTVDFEETVSRLRQAAEFIRVLADTAAT